MVTQKTKVEIRSRLMRLRNERLRLRERQQEDWEGARGREVEPEESAQKQTISSGLGQLDRAEKEAVEAVDRALGRLESGSYGICLSCGKSIPDEQLEAVPWREFCLSCEREAEQEQAGRAASGTPELSVSPAPQRFQGMSDDEVAQAVREGLRNDGRVQLEELLITFHDGSLHLEGALPSSRKHRVLLDFVQNTLGLKNLVDEVRIDRLAWEGAPESERADEQRVRKSGVPYDEIEEAAMAGTDEAESVFHSMKSGKPVAPPDELVPEEDS